MNRGAIVTAAGALAVAGGIHIAALGDHRSEGWPVAGFFAAVALAQVAAAIVVLRGATPAIRAAIIIGNVAVIALWTVSRTTGMPFGPHAGPPAPVGALDLVAVAAQVVAVVAALRLSRRRVERPLRPAMALAGVALLVAVASTQLLPAERHADADQGRAGHGADHEHSGAHSHP